MIKMKERLLHSIASARNSSIGAPPFRGARDCSYRTPPGYGASVHSAKLSRISNKSTKCPINNTTTNGKDRRRIYFARILVAVGIGKILLGCILSTVGVLSLLHASTLGYLAAGLWGGFCLILTGSILLLASRYTANRLYMVSSMSLLLINLAVVGLVLLFSSIGVSRDYWRQQHAKSGVAVSSGVNSYSETLLLNSVQCLVAITDLLLSLACICVCTHHLCECGSVFRAAFGQCRKASPQKQWKRFRDSSVSDRLSHKNHQIPVIPWNFASLQQPSTVAPSILVPVPIHPHHYIAQSTIQQMPTYVDSVRQQHYPQRIEINQIHPEAARHQPDNTNDAGYIPNSPNDARYRSNTPNDVRHKAESESEMSCDFSAIYTGRDRDIAEEFIVTTMQTIPTSYSQPGQRY